MLRNSFFSIIATGVRLLAALALFIVMAQVWGPRSFGVFMYPYTVATILAKLVDYGFTLQLMRDIGKAPREAAPIMRRALGAKLLLVIPLLSVGVVVGFLMPDDGPYRILLALLLCDAIANSFAIFVNTSLRALGRFDAEAYVVTASNLLLVIVVVGIIAVGFGPIAAAVGFLVVRIGYLVASWLISERVLGEPLRADWLPRPLLAVLKDGFPFAVHATAGLLVMHVDTLLVQHYLGAAAVGIYQAGMRVMIGAVAIAEALNNVYLAALAPVVHRPEEVDRLGTRMTRHLLAIGVIAFLCTIGGSKWIVQALFNDKYSELVGLFPLFGLLMFIRYGGLSYGTLLTLSDKQVVRMIAVICTLFLSLMVNVALIPRFGLAGAVWTAALSTTALYAVYMVAVWLDHRNLLLDRRSLSLVGIALVALLMVSLPGAATGLTHLQLGLLLFPLAVILGLTRTDVQLFLQRTVRLGRPARHRA